MSQMSQRERFLRNERFTAIVTGLIVSVMMACFAVLIVQLAQRVAPGWNGEYLPIVCFAIAVEAILSTRLARQLGLYSLQQLVYRGTELVLILLMLRVLLYALRGFDRLWVGLARWMTGILAFIEGEYMFSALVVLSVWLLSCQFANTLIEFEGDVELLESRETLASDRGSVRRALGTQILAVGGVMLFGTALIRSDLSRFGIHTMLSATGVNVMLYFVLGLLLFSLSQFAVLRAGWSIERISIGGNMASRWVVSSIALLVCLALVVSLLPTRYSVGLLDTLVYALNVLFLVASSTIFLIFWLLGSLLAFLFRAPPPEPMPQPQPIPVPPSLAAEPAVTPPWLEVAQSLLFWIVFLAIVGYSVIYYFRERKGLIAFIRRLPYWAWLVSGWHSLRRRARDLNQGIVGAVQSRLRRAPLAVLREPWSYLSVRRLSPRDRVRFFYLAMVRRGGESGVPRQLSQTPYEYENDLDDWVPEVDEDVAALTNAFVEARYSLHEITPRQAATMGGYWGRIQRALRKRRPDSGKGKSA